MTAPFVFSQNVSLFIAVVLGFFFGLFLGERRFRKPS